MTDQELLAALRNAKHPLSGMATTAIAAARCSNGYSGERTQVGEGGFNDCVSMQPKGGE
jgi:hypothetical protein